MFERDGVSINSGIITFKGASYPASKVDSVTVDNSAKVKASVAACFLWVVGASYALDFYQSSRPFALDAAIFCLIFGVAALIAAMSKKVPVVVRVSGKKAIQMRASDRQSANAIKDAINDAVRAA
ncbi:DUF6232 family protein [Komagataeibacter saccharivorans]|uniref:DUF6232 family protein n=1 Tax=Komagataeibacter saccharivorans TaxID=265959 RepID=UPI000C85FD6E|nr:DUF6232 family protein [Komagataeibacter saccharivorans]